MKKKKYIYIDLGLHVILLQVSEVIEECFLVIILPKSYLNLQTFIHMQTSIYHIIKIKAMDLLL